MAESNREKMARLNGLRIKQAVSAVDETLEAFEKRAEEQSAARAHEEPQPRTSPSKEKNTKTTNVTIRMRDDVKERVESVCRMKRCTITDYIYSLVEADLETNSEAYQHFREVMAQFEKP